MPIHLTKPLTELERDTILVRLAEQIELQQQRDSAWSNHLPLTDVLAEIESREKSLLRQRLAASTVPFDRNRLRSITKKR